jgi:hypothetical protein
MRADYQTASVKLWRKVGADNVATQRLHSAKFENNGGPTFVDPAASLFKAALRGHSNRGATVGVDET